MTKLISFGFFALGLCMLAALPAAAQDCSPAEIARVVDKGSEDLRALNARLEPALNARLLELQKARGWSDHDLDEKGAAYLEDPTTRTLDKETNALITRMEVLSDASATSPPPCERIVELQSTLARMREIASEKSKHVLARLDGALKQGQAATPPAASPPTSAPSAKAKTAPSPAPSRSPSPSASWSTTTKADPRPPASAPAPAPGVPPAPIPQLPQAAVTEQQTYSRDEIHAAGRGFFGAISTGLASVLDYAFQAAGRPSGYILGDEGGGAFLAGVRYGKGKLHIKGQPPQDVYWRGPSIGYDFGASGSRMMVLVYNIREPGQIYGNFAGLDGSAYLVGGVGMTFLTNGEKFLAPIRSGIGLRFGASVGYLKFSNQPSWNPF